LQVLCAMRCSLQLIRELICLDGILLHFERWNKVTFPLGWWS
jgi:hypothetical protein